MIDVAKKILSSPKQFFKTIEKEKGIKKAFKFLAFFLAIFLVLNATVSIILGNNGNLPSQLTFIPFWQLVILVSALIYVASLLYSFLGAGIIYVWLKIFKGKRSYNDAYKLNTYSKLPIYLFGWIPFVGWLAWIYAFVLLVIGTKEFYKFSTTKAVLIYLIPMLIIMLILVLLIVLLLFAGLSGGYAGGF